jgi:hypothetical protein
VDDAHETRGGKKGTGFWQGNLQEKDHLEGVGLRWEDNIKMNLGGICWNGVDWINLAQDSDKWRDSLNAVVKLWVP